MNASVASRLNEVTAPLDAHDAPQTHGMAFDAGVQRANDTAGSAALLWLPGQVIGNRYRIGRVLEVGGMATVYEAMQLDLVRRVAIKVPTAECAADPACARRFEREARTLAELQHPHIVSVFELGRSEEGVAFMAMELIEGQTLRAHLAAERTLPWPVAAGFAAQLADALEAAHVAGVVHGDVSAANVLLKRRGDSLVCKLIDFGAARRMGDDHLTHHTYGTRRHVAPELFRGVAPHVRSDLFALGAVLNEMLGDTALATCPPLLQQLVRSMLDEDPQLRPDSAAKVALLLRDAFDSPAATAPPNLEAPMRADPHDAPRRSYPALPASRLRRRWLAAGLVGGAVICALVAYDRYQTPARLPAIRSAAVAPPVNPTRAQPATALQAARIVPASVAVPRHQATVAAGVPAPVPVPVFAPTAAPAAEGEAADDESSAASARGEIIASLDRWFAARNQNNAGERVPLVATRVGEPSIVFDPSGTSASVTYRMREVYARSNRESIIEEQVFFAKPGEVWQIFEADND